MDVVYILGKGSRWNDNEIRYSLRSLEKNFSHDRVFIVGECPPWLQNVIFIPFPDNHPIKTSNGIDKVMKAAGDKRVSQSFVLMNDDFFFLQHEKYIPYYYRGTSADFIQRHQTRNGYYYDTLVRTEAFLIERGLHNLKDYEIHAPIVYEKSKLLKLQKENIYNRQIRSLYCNVFKVKGVQVEDFKANNLMEFRHQLQRNTSYLSIGDHLTGEKEFINWISQKFPHPSKYEAHQLKQAKKPQ